MLRIEITIPRPRQTLAFIIAGILGAMLWGTSFSASAEGGRGGPPLRSLAAIEEDLRRERSLHEVLRRQEEILRMELRALSEEKEKLSGVLSKEEEQEFHKVRRRLLALLVHERRAEERLREFLEELWASEDRLRTLTAELPHGHLTKLQWPADPSLGLSSEFLDSAYEERFGFAHLGIDIPVLQGTPVTAAADGVVTDVTDNGTGYNSLTILHTGGFATLYGHVSSFLVKEGQRVRAGEAVALSGGRPGSIGAGSFTTGPHLHFEVSRQGAHVDPLPYLPAHPVVASRGLEAPS